MVNEGISDDTGLIIVGYPCGARQRACSLEPCTICSFVCCTTAATTVSLRQQASRSDLDKARPKSLCFPTRRPCSRGLWRTSTRKKLSTYSRFSRLVPSSKRPTRTLPNYYCCCDAVVSPKCFRRNLHSFLVTRGGLYRLPKLPKKFVWRTATFPKHTGEYRTGPCTVCPRESLSERFLCQTIL